MGECFAVGVQCFVFNVDLNVDINFLTLFTTRTSPKVVTGSNVIQQERILGFNHPHALSTSEILLEWETRCLKIEARQFSFIPFTMCRADLTIFSSVVSVVRSTSCTPNVLCLKEQYAVILARRPLH